MPRSVTASSYDSCMLSDLRNCHTVFQSGYPIPTSNVLSICDPVSLHPWQHLVLSLFYFGHSDRYVVMSHCGFNFHFPNGKECWISFHELICHLNVIFEEMSLCLLPMFQLDCLLFCFALSYWYNLDTNPDTY